MFKTAFSFILIYVNSLSIKEPDLSWKNIGILSLCHNLFFSYMLIADFRMSAYLISCQMTTQMKTVNSPLFFSTHSHCMQTEIRPAFKKQTAEDHILFITFWLKLHFTPSTSLRYSQIYMSLFRLGASGILTIIFLEILFFIFLSKWLFHQRSSLLQSSVCAGKGRSGAGEGGAGWKEVVLSLTIFLFIFQCSVLFVLWFLMGWLLHQGWLHI